MSMLLRRLLLEYVSYLAVCVFALDLIAIAPGVTRLLADFANLYPRQ